MTSLSIARRIRVLERKLSIATAALESVKNVDDRRDMKGDYANGYKAGLGDCAESCTKALKEIAAVDA
jgi:hypothetical protein